MAKFLGQRGDSERNKYVFELTRDEAYMIHGIVNDLVDNRDVYMAYPKDGSPVKPSKFGSDLLKDVNKALDKAKPDAVEYDYFMFWDELEDA